MSLSARALQFDSHSATVVLFESARATLIDSDTEWSSVGPNNDRNIVLPLADLHWPSHFLTHARHNTRDLLGPLFLYVNECDCTSSCTNNCITIIFAFVFRAGQPDRYSPPAIMCVCVCVCVVRWL